MIKAIILDDGYHSNDVVIKFGENYKSISLVYFLNLPRLPKNLFGIFWIVPQLRMLSLWYMEGG